MANIPMIEVVSSQIHAIGHDPDTDTLAVQFKSKSSPGPVYRYANVDAELFDRFRNADSIGRFFGTEIKPYPAAYPYTRQDEDQPA